MKHKTKLLIRLCILILMMPLALAITISEETSSVSRIVGESPTEMLGQMQRDKLEIGHATYYTDDNFGNDKDDILKKQFGNNVVGNAQGSLDDWIATYSFNDVDNAVKNLQKNELLIIESGGDIEPLKAKSTQDEITPTSVKSWQQSFEKTNPLMLWDSAYAGSYLPKEDTFISKLAKDSTIIAPMSFNSPQFTKSLLCNMFDGKTIGQVFKEARNFHYNGGSKSSGDNLIGLVLQSYALYGNPRQKVIMDWAENNENKEKIKKYCSNFLENLAADIEFLGKDGPYSKFRKHLILEIPSYSTEKVGDFSLINAENTFQNLEFGELVLPVAVRATHFPLNTIITGYSVESVTDAVEIELKDLPTYELDFVSRACYNDKSNYQIDFENAYTETKHNFIARITPVEVVNCEEGRFRLYKKFKYSVDYIPISPVLIKKIDAPLLAHIDEIVEANIELMPITNKETRGILAIFDDKNNKLWEKEITSDATSYKASFKVPSTESVNIYSVEFMQEGETLTYDTFTVYTVILEPKVEIPVSVSSEQSIKFNFYSHIQSNFDLNGKYYLFSKNSVVKEGEFSKTINQGDNYHILSFSGLSKAEQSYTLILELSYLGSKKALSYLLNTNNVPILYAVSKPEYYEGEQVVIKYLATDYDNDNVKVKIDDKRFENTGSAFVWNSKEGDAGSYKVTITADDSYSKDTVVAGFSILPMPKENGNGDSGSGQTECISNPNIVDCPDSGCEYGNWVEYPPDGYDKCQDNKLIAYSCAPISSTPDNRCKPSDDTDNDGIKNNYDKCPNTPLGEGVNADGCSCKQIPIPNSDDICIAYQCENGIIKEVNNDKFSQYVDCHDARCEFGNWVTYQNDGNNYCVNKQLIKHDCGPISSTPDEKCKDDDDADNDGIKDEIDKCQNTPETEIVNPDGCGCTQLIVEDGNNCTIDSCDKGAITRTNNDLYAVAANCPSDGCVVGGNWADYHDSGIIKCIDMKLTTHSCEPIEVKPDERCKNLMDDDNDQVPNINDNCPNTPTNEWPNANGCSCSQIDKDDHNDCTIDTCYNDGAVEHKNNDDYKVFVECPPSKCEGRNWVIYSESDYNVCRDLKLDEHICYKIQTTESQECINSMDSDSDGDPDATDCEPNNPAISSKAQELCDNIDNNCNKQIDENLDEEYYTSNPDTENKGTCKAGIKSCTSGNWIIKVPEATPTDEICDSLDNDCDGEIDEGVEKIFYKDNDKDGYGDANNMYQKCVKPYGYSANSNDCDDNNFAINPDRLEVFNGLDDNCDGKIDENNPSFTLELKKGINLVAFPLNPAYESSVDWKLANIEWQIGPELSLIIYKVAGTDDFKSYSYSKGIGINKDVVRGTDGYILTMASDKTITLKGKEWNDNELHLEKGINLIGFPDEFVGKKFSDFMNDERYKDTVTLIAFYDYDEQKFRAYLKEYGIESQLNKVIKDTESYVVNVK